MNHKNNVCPICKSADFKTWFKTKDVEYITSDEEYTYYECSNCIAIFIDEFPVSKLSEIYPPPITTHF